MADALVARGNAIKEEIFGPEHGQAKLDRATEFPRAFEELVCGIPAAVDGFRNATQALDELGIA